MAVAPVTCQHSLVEPPASIVVGVATKTTTCGTVPVDTVTVIGAVTVLPSLDVADHTGYEQREEASPRLRLLIRRADDRTWIPESVPGGAAIAERLELEATYPTSTALLAGIRKNIPDFRVRLVQPIQLDEGAPFVGLPSFCARP